MNTLAIKITFILCVVLNFTVSANRIISAKPVTKPNDAFIYYGGDGGSLPGSGFIDGFCDISWEHKHTYIPIEREYSDFTVTKKVIAYHKGKHNLSDMRQDYEEMLATNDKEGKLINFKRYIWKSERLVQTTDVTINYADKTKNYFRVKNITQNKTPCNLVVTEVPEDFTLVLKEKINDTAFIYLDTKGRIKDTIYRYQGEKVHDTLFRSWHPKYYPYDTTFINIQKKK